MLKHLFSLLLLLGVAGVIFMFSSQTYEEQSLVPLLQKLLPGEPLAGVLSQVEVSYWGKLISVETKGYYYFIEFFIRKFAHVFLFGCLAVALFRVVVYWRPRRITLAIGIALIGTGLYAAFDEFHQLLTGGRTPLVNDVFLDFIGAALALVLYVPVYLIRRKRKKRN
ncbi:VanZ family protein [Bacillus ectoiniformans]|uniref:VanZ family protein n=1 Tax=Bacillus ectoiniformans TaxID=1494429 RepID=UPI00195E5CA0|nr:VanZ family protein [Bacillus ectoiniformans]MBM7649274.1 VanZ family protein [Bacillus ectoiniformans]